jgi:type I restriction enzyme R subunit
VSHLPEQQARQTIDAMHTASGWAVQDYKAFNPSASSGIALREVPLKSGRCDYLLLVGRKLSANLQRATRLRQSILQKAFTGKL